MSIYSFTPNNDLKRNLDKIIKKSEFKNAQAYFEHKISQEIDTIRKYPNRPIR